MPQGLGYFEPQETLVPPPAVVFVGCYIFPTGAPLYDCKRFFISSRFRDIRPQHMQTSNERIHTYTNEHDELQYLLAEE